MNFIFDLGLKKFRIESESFLEKIREITFQLWFIHPIRREIFSTANHAAVKRKIELGFLRK